MRRVEVLTKWRAEKTTGLVLQRQEHHRPGKNRDGEVEQGEPGNDEVDTAQVQHHAESDRECLGRREAGPDSGDGDGRADQRIRFNREALRVNAEVGQRPVEALDDDEQDDSQVTEQPVRGVQPAGHSCLSERRSC